MLNDMQEFFSGLLSMLQNGAEHMSSDSYQTLDSAEFFARRLDEYERTLAILVSRVAESQGYGISVCSDLEELMRIVSTQRDHFQVMSYHGDQDDLTNESVNTSRASIISTQVLRCGEVGRPRLNISEECLRSLHDTVGLRWMDVARTLGVSDRTLRRRRQEFNMVGENFSSIEDIRLDAVVGEILCSYPKAGSRIVTGFLRNRGFNVQRKRILESLRRVDPVTSSLRSERSILRRRYSVPHPNFMWHIDGNHKLVQPYRFVIHGGIDGYSRLITFLRASTNNRSETVLAHFRGAVGEYGVPSHVRCDFGLENILVGRYMVQTRGINQNSIITGRSVRNQRIERLWRDLNRLVISTFRNIFLYLESHSLDVDDEVHLYALHIVYLPRINNALTEFLHGWNHHSVSTENNLSPRQLWFQGMVTSINQNYIAVEELVQGDGNWDNIGIDEDGPVPEQEPENILTVPRSTIELSPEQNEQLHNLLLSAEDDPHGVISFDAVVNRLAMLFTN